MQERKRAIKYRVGIVSIDDSCNLGNRLQNLAMQKLLSDMGYDVKTFHRDYALLAHRTVKNRIRFLCGKFAFLFRHFYRRAFGLKRLYRFHRFNQKYIKWDGHLFEDVCGAQYLGKMYDALVVGSDQVWNFQFHFNTEENLLCHVPSSIKKISVAASIGNIRLTEREKELFQRNLGNFDAVSVREQSSIPLLQPYYSKKIVQIKDPTLLVGRKYWETIQRESDLQVGKNSALCFFLGGVSGEISKFCAELEHKYQMNMIWSNDDRNPYYGIGPIDFIKLVHNVEYILTDSFHCSVFSILFQKKFSIYDRMTKEMNTSNRTDELLEIFRIQNAKNIFSVEELTGQIPQSGDFIDAVLESEKRKMETFVRESLGRSFV